MRVRISYQERILSSNYEEVLNEYLASIGSLEQCKASKDAFIVGYPSQKSPAYFTYMVFEHKSFSSNLRENDTFGGFKFYLNKKLRKPTGHRNHITELTQDDYINQLL